ncbi:MAG TPA: hypothetical protein VH436_27915 [Vicinamibacterales bacterium]|jgi:hypothetical protein
MKAGCPREVEVVASLLDRRSLRIDDDALAAHVEGCESCREVAELTRVMSTDHERTRREIRVPAAGQVWWRAAVRARLEAVHTASRPLTWWHGIAGACAIGVVMALLGVAWPVVRESAGWIVTRALDAAVPLGAEAATVVTTSIHGSVALVLVAAACILFAPVALYFALSDE